MNFLARLQEPSTYVSLAVLAALVSPSLGDMINAAAEPLMQMIAAGLALFGALKKDPGSES